MPDYTQRKALKVKDVLAVYFEARENGLPERRANEKARALWMELFGTECDEKTIRRRAARVEAFGGWRIARIEAYADAKSTPHHKARLIEKLGVPNEFIRAFKSKCLEPGVCMVSAAYRSFEIAWMSGIEVPGYGVAPKLNQPFPLTVHQCREFAPSRAAMLQAGRGKFAAKVSKALPTIVTSSSELRRCERYLFDDTRVNIAALDDHTGHPVELKSYWCMDEATRQIVGYLARQAGACRASDVDALVARVLRTCGLAAPSAGYVTTLKFERGTVACSPARQIFLEAMFPGRLRFSRTA